MKKEDLLKEITRITNIVFDNEKSFMKNIFEKDHTNQWDELIEFYMGEESTKLTVLLSSGDTISTSVDTQNIFNWLESL